MTQTKTYQNRIVEVRSYPTKESAEKAAFSTNGGPWKVVQLKNGRWALRK